MKVVVQRVTRASVSVEGGIIASSGKGFLLLAGISRDDSPESVSAMARKVLRLRVFDDPEGKMNLDIGRAGGEILSVPQFTLLGDTSKGNRPGFDGAAPPEKAAELYRAFNAELAKGGIAVKEGRFGAHMEVTLVNDGPVTFILEN